MDVTNILLLRAIMLKNKTKILFVPFVRHIELQNFLIAPRTCYRLAPNLMILSDLMISVRSSVFSERVVNNLLSTLWTLFSSLNRFKRLLDTVDVTLLTSYSY